MSSHLLRALAEMLPIADIELVSERPWHSLVFSGMQLSFEAAVPGNHNSHAIDKFARELSGQNFDLPGLLVADIAVTRQIEEQNQKRLTIDALLLED
jgi:hypothetical protein